MHFSTLFLLIICLVKIECIFRPPSTYNANQTSNLWNATNAPMERTVLYTDEEIEIIGCCENLIPIKPNFWCGKIVDDTNLDQFEDIPFIYRSKISDFYFKCLLNGRDVSDCCRYYMEG